MCVCVCVCVCVCASHCTVLAQCGGWSHLLAAANSKREGVVQRDRLHSDWQAQCLVSCESQRERDRLHSDGKLSV